MIEIINPNSVALANHSSSSIANQFANASALDRTQQKGGALAAGASPLTKGGYRGVGRGEAPASTFRAAFLRSIREEIESGAYETPQRLAGTVDRLLDVIA